MEEIKVTVTIAVYNVERYIARTLKSVLNQDFESLEILVVDDCGTDKSIAIVKQIAQEHTKGEKVRIIHHPQNQGTGATRNSGIDNAKGEYILFLDGDDYLPHNAVSLLYYKMQKTHSDFIIGQHALIDEQGTEIYRTHFYPSHIEEEFAIAAWMRENSSDYYPVALWNKLFKTSFLKESAVRCVPWHKQEDLWFTTQLSYIAKSIETISEVTLFYVRRDGSELHCNMTEKQFINTMDIFNRSLVAIIDYEQQTGKKVPKEQYHFLTSRYLKGYMTRNVLQSSFLNRSVKNYYLYKIVSTLSMLGVRRNDLIGRKNKIIWCFLKTPFRYPLMMAALSIGIVQKH